MEIIYFIIGIIALTYIQKAYKWIKFKTKYPLLSKEIPSGILSVGDEVVFEDNRRMEFAGINREGSINYLFMPENSVTPVSYKEREVIDKIDTVYGEFGIKWKRA